MRSMKDAEIIAVVEKIHDELGIVAPEHIDVALVCAHYGLFARFRDLDDEEAHLVCDGRRRAIVHLAERTRGSHKEAFSRAHELGHWKLHPDLGRFVSCSGIGHAGPRSPGREREAHVFASNFLLPRRIFGPLCAQPRPSLHDVSALADRFRASLSATGLRYVRFAASACAIVCSRAGRVAWAKQSATFAGRIVPGSALGGGAFARLVFAGERPPDALVPADARAWGIEDPGVDLYEHTRAIDGRNAALSLLWHPA